VQKPEIDCMDKTGRSTFVQTLICQRAGSGPRIPPSTFGLVKPITAPRVGSVSRELEFVEIVRFDL
jgi:hypothetical protein